jgi:hypothetical protein
MGMSIMVHRDKRDYGPYTLEEIKDLMQQNLVSETDNAFVEGGAVWRPLGELLDEKRAEDARSSAGPGMLPLAGVLAVLLLIVLVLVVEMRGSLEPWLALTHSPAGK